MTDAHTDLAPLPDHREVLRELFGPDAGWHWAGPWYVRSWDNGPTGYVYERAVRQDRWPNDSPTVICLWQVSRETLDTPVRK